MLQPGNVRLLGAIYRFLLEHHAANCRLAGSVQAWSWNYERTREILPRKLRKNLKNQGLGETDLRNRR